MLFCIIGGFSTPLIVTVKLWLALEGLPQRSHSRVSYPTPCHVKSSQSCVDLEGFKNALCTHIANGNTFDSKLFKLVVALKGRTYTKGIVEKIQSLWSALLHCSGSRGTDRFVENVYDALLVMRM